MLENIVRHIEEGEKPLEAAYKGAKEIGFTIISLTVSLVAVFIPLLFMSGIVGRLFREFALTLTAAVLVSAVISLTLTPMMCGRLLRGGMVRHEHEDEDEHFLPSPSPFQGEGRGEGGDYPGSQMLRWGGENLSLSPLPRREREQNREERGFFPAMHRRYATSLHWVMQRQTATLWVAVITFAATILLYIFMPKGFLPQEDTGQIIVSTDAAESVSFREMSRLQNQVAQIIGEDPEVASVASFLGVGTVNITANTGHMAVMLKPYKNRDNTAQEIIARLSPKLVEIPGIATHLQAAQDIQIGARSSRTQYQYTLADLNGVELSEWTAKLVEKLNGQSTLLRPCHRPGKQWPES